MASERNSFWRSGPLHLTAVDWDNAGHQSSVATCLVKGVYLLERDSQKNRRGSEALAPPWWEFFHFGLVDQLVDDADNSIFGAVYEFKLSASSHDEKISRRPRYVIAFRGNLLKLDSFYRDLKLDLHLIQLELHKTSRSKIAIESVLNMVAAVGDADIWLAGQSLGSAIAMQAGKTMAKNGHFLKTFLFNPPFLSLPIEIIKYKKVKQGIRIAESVTKAGLDLAKKVKDLGNQSEDPWNSSMVATRDAIAIQTLRVQVAPTCFR